MSSILSFHLHWLALCVSLDSDRLEAAMNGGKAIFNPARLYSMNPGLSIVEPTDGAILDRLHKRSMRDGEERLMLAVLENATEDFQKYVLATNRRGVELFQAAEQWILETDNESLFSFESICEHLQLDANYLRAGFMRWKAAKLGAQLKQSVGSGQG